MTTRKLRFTQTVAVLVLAILSPSACGSASSGGPHSTTSPSSTREQEWAAATTAHRFMLEDLENILPFRKEGDTVVKCASTKFERYISASEFSKSVTYHAKALRQDLISCESGPEREEDEIKRQKDKEAEAGGTLPLAAKESNYDKELEKQEEELQKAK